MDEKNAYTFYSCHIIIMHGPNQEFVSPKSYFKVKNQESFSPFQSLKQCVRPVWADAWFLQSSGLNEGQTAKMAIYQNIGVKCLQQKQFSKWAQDPMSLNPSFQDPNTIDQITQVWMKSVCLLGIQSNSLSIYYDLIILILFRLTRKLDDSPWKKKMVKGNYVTLKNNESTD